MTVVNTVILLWNTLLAKCSEGRFYDSEGIWNRILLRCYCNVFVFYCGVIIIALHLTIAIVNLHRRANCSLEESLFIWWNVQTRQNYFLWIMLSSAKIYWGIHIGYSYFAVSSSKEHWNVNLGDIWQQQGYPLSVQENLLNIHRYQGSIQLNFLRIWKSSWCVSRRRTQRQNNKILHRWNYKSVMHTCS